MPRNKRQLPSSLAILAGAFAMCWPAFYNRFPLLFPDSVNYLNDGRYVVEAILGGPAAPMGWMRSPLYSLVVYPLHWGHSPWPVVGLHALVTAWMLWLVVRSQATRQGTSTYLGLVAFLSVFTGVGWVVSWILPDVLGPVLYLAFYLLIFARDSLSRLEAGLVGCLVVGSIASHTTHLILSVAFCALFGLVLLLSPEVRQSRGKSVRLVAILVAIAIVIQVALNGLLTGRPSLNGPHPPFLMARLVADGPARLVLQQRCGQLQWVLCKFADRLPTDSNEFLWGAGNVMNSVTPEEAEQLRREELPLLWATLRDHPAEQMRVSLGNFWRQLVTYDLDDFRNNPWAANALGVAMPAAAASYHRGLQSRDALPVGVFSGLQGATIPVAVLLLAVTLPYCWRRRHTRLLGLSVVLIPMIVANAFLTGVLSLVDSRYQLRVVWLLPFAAALVLLQVLDDRRGARRAVPQAPDGPRGLRTTSERIAKARQGSR